MVFECARFLASKDHDVTVIANEFETGALHGVRCHKVPKRWGGSVPGLFEFRHESSRAVASTKPVPDVLGTFGVQCPPGGVFWVPSVHAAWINTCETSRAAYRRLRQRCNPFHPVILAMERYHFAGRRYRKLIALTPDVKRHLMEFYGVPDSDVSELPNGFSASEFSMENRGTFRPAVRRELGYTDRDRVVIFVANELERKGFLPLLRAMAQLDDPRVRLLAVGRLDPRGCMREIARLGMSGRVHFTGPTSEVARYYAAADVFALPTQYEAWGLVIVEAMASGLPVLTSRLAGAAVAVREPLSGRLLDDPKGVDEIASKLAPLIAGDHGSSEAISESVAEYQWSRVLKCYEGTLLDCLAPQGSPADF